MAVDPDRKFGLTRSEWAIALFVLVAVGLFLHPYRAQQASRYTLTAAIVEQGTVVIDDYESVLGRDRSISNGHIYSDKAPGQPFLAVPFFAAGKLAGVEDATRLRIEGNLGLWWVTLWSASVPAAALAVMIYRRALKVQPVGAAIAVAAAIGGTLLMPLSGSLFGHVLAAALLYGSFLLVEDERAGIRLALGGLLAGLAVTVEYTVVLGVVVLSIFALLRHRAAIWPWIAGAVPAALGLALYNSLAFGDPLTLSYQFSAFNEVAETSRGVTAMFGSASVDNVLRLLFEGRGLLVATPVVGLAVVASVVWLRRHAQIDALMFLLMLASFIWIPILWANPWGGDSPGARYMTPAMAFVGVPIAYAWARWRRTTLFLSGMSILTMGVASFTDPFLPRDTNSGLNRWLQRLASGDAADTLPVYLLGGFGWIVHLALAAALGWWLVLGTPRDRDSDPRLT